MFPVVAMVASKTGDPNGKYAKFLKEQDAQYPAQAWFLWEQPLSDSGLNVATSQTNSGGGADGKSDGNGSGAAVTLWRWTPLLAILLPLSGHGLMSTIT